MPLNTSRATDPNWRETLQAKGFKMIPLAKSKPCVPPLEELTLTLFGKPGQGKTTLAAGCPDTFLIGTEPGQEFVGAPSQDVRSWQQFMDLVNEIYEAVKMGAFGYRTVSIDIIDNLAGYCLTHVCQRKGLEYPPENDYGKTWKEIRMEWESWLRALMDVSGVQFLTHCTTEKVEIPGKVPNSTKEVDCMLPTFRGSKLAQYLDGIVNAMGYVHKDVDNNHVITFLSTATCGAKDRTKLLGRLGVLNINANSPEEAWQILSGNYRQLAESLGYGIKSRWDK